MPSSQVVLKQASDWLSVSSDRLSLRAGVLLVSKFSSPPLGGTGRPEWAGAGHLPSLGRFRCDNTLAGEVLVGWFLLRADLVKNTVPGIFQNSSFPLLLPETQRGFFSDIYSGILGEFLEVNLTILSGLPYAWVPWRFLAPRLVHGEPPAVWQSQFREPHAGTGSWGGFRCRVSALSGRDSLYSHV